MTGLRTSLAEFHPPFLPPPPQKPACAKAAADVASRIAAVNEIEPQDPEGVLARFRAALASKDWQNLTFRDWKAVLWVAFSGSPALVDDERFLARLCNVFRAAGRRSGTKALIAAYGRNFDCSSHSRMRTLERIALEIRAALTRVGGIWQERNEQFSLFTPENAAARVASICLLPGMTPDKVLDLTGFGGERYSGGFARGVFLEALIIAADRLEQGRFPISSLNTLLTWSRDTDGFRYPGTRVMIANALLLPWIKQPPAPELQERIQEFLLRHFKDPRLPANHKTWNGVDEDAKMVMRRWLTRVALEQFCEVVDRVAREEMWTYRRSFWLAYHNLGVIDDAWVLFGPDAQTYALRAFGDAREYGSLMRGGPGQIQSNHSVLLLKVGDLTIADWSHNGMCRIWYADNVSAPRLYGSAYRRDELVGNSNFEQAHHGAASGTWQSKIEAEIRRKTGIRLTRREFMP